MLPCVGDDQRLALCDHMFAEGVRQRRFAPCRPGFGQADGAFEKLALVINQRHQSHWSACDRGGKPGQAIKGVLLSAVEKVQLLQLGEARQVLDFTCISEGLRCWSMSQAHNPRSRTPTVACLNRTPSAIV